MDGKNQTSRITDIKLFFTGSGRRKAALALTLMLLGMFLFDEGQLAVTVEDGGANSETDEFEQIENMLAQLEGQNASPTIDDTHAVESGTEESPSSDNDSPPALFIPGTTEPDVARTHASATTEQKKSRVRGVSWPGQTQASSPQSTNEWSVPADNATVDEPTETPIPPRRLRIRLTGSILPI